MVWSFGLSDKVNAGMAFQFNRKKDLVSQQAGADIVIFYGSDLKKDSNNLIIINGKSTNTGGVKSMAPNLISIRKILLNHVKYIFAAFPDNAKKREELFSLRNYWFIAIYTGKSSDGVKVEDVHLKDLYKNNVEKIYINFSAALQLQLHVKDMEQIQSQTSKEFIAKLAVKVNIKWQEHCKKKNKEYQEYAKFHTK